MRYLWLTLALTLPVAAQDWVQGFDQNGQVRACHPMRPDEEICTMEFTEGDQYAKDCQEAGGEAVQCGCHDYLCIIVTD